MNGTLLGMERVGWGNIPFVAMETQGADSLNACVRAGNWVTLDEITRLINSSYLILIFIIE